MPGNVQPIFAGVPKIGFAQITTADTGAAVTNGVLIFTADATNGSIVNEVRIKYVPGNNTAATVVRILINNGSTAGTATNNSIIAELAIAAITSVQNAATPDYVIPMPRGGLALPPGYRLYATIGTSLGGSGAFMITALGGDY